MKIATIGSCQAMALNWYIKKLRPTNDVKWCCSELWHSWEHAPSPYSDENSHWKTQVYDNIWKTQECIDYIKAADYIVYQKIDPSTSEMFNYLKIESYKKQDAQTATFSFIQAATEDELRGMQERESKLNFDIAVSEMILNHKKKNMFKLAEGGNHPNSTMFLELLREVCYKFNWSFFNDREYNNIEKQGYPFIKFFEDTAE